MSIGNFIQINVLEDWPLLGSMILGGAQGTVAVLPFLDVTSYRVDVDTDGDGLWDDYTCGSLLWSDL